MNRNEMLATLVDRGYEVSARRLTDWIQKGLLPRPQRHGLGRGKGRTLSEWPEDCLSQAMVIADLFRMHYKARNVTIVLWLLGFPVSSNLVRDAILERLDIMSFMADIQKTVGGDAQSEDNWADGVSRLIARFSDMLPADKPESPATDELLWQVLLNPRFRLTRDTVREVQGELQSLQADRIRQQDIWSAVRFAQQRLHVADLYETASTASLEEWDQARRTWQEILNSGQQFSRRVGWSRREWRFISYQFIQVVGPWLLKALLTLRHQGEVPWVDETVRSLTVTLDGMAHDISVNPDAFAVITAIFEPRIEKTVEGLLAPSHRRRSRRRRGSIRKQRESIPGLARYPVAV